MESKRTGLGTQERTKNRIDLWRYLSCEEVLVQMQNDVPFMRNIYNKLESHLAREQLDKKEREAANILKDRLAKAVVTQFPLLNINSVLWEPLIQHLNRIPSSYREAIYYALRSLKEGQTKVTITLQRYNDRGDFLDAVEETFTHLAPCFGISFSSDESFSYCNVTWNSGSILIPSEINPHFRMVLF